MTSYGQNIRVHVTGGSGGDKIFLMASGIPSGIPVDTDSITAFLLRCTREFDGTFTQGSGGIPVFISGVDRCATTGEELKITVEDACAWRMEQIKKAVPRTPHDGCLPCAGPYEAAVLSDDAHFFLSPAPPLCVLGSLLKDELARHGFFIGAHICSIGTVSDRRFDPVGVSACDFDTVLSNSLPVLEADAAEKMREVIRKAKLLGDSVGGMVECAVVGLPAGVGEGLFGGMESRISSIVFSLPAVKGIEFGAGFASAAMTGSESRDSYETDGVNITAKTNNCGGVLGGITDGKPIVFRAALKPVPSVDINQGFSFPDTQNRIIAENSEHYDPCTAVRAVPVIEAATAVAVFDALLCTKDGADRLGVRRTL